MDNNNNWLNNELIFRQKKLSAINSRHHANQQKEAHNQQHLF